jgi:AcrR family transcriptional regulator
MARVDTQASGVGDAAVHADGSRPLRADARRNRERVLEAARAAFGDEGSDVSLDEIARRAGVGAGTVYRHFATKDALFEAVVLHRIGELVADAQALSHDPDPACAFSSFVVCLGREGALKRDLIEALASDGIHLQLGDAPIVQALIDVLAELLHRAQSAGAVRSDINVDDVVTLLTGTAYAISHSGSDEERTGRLLAIMYDGMRADRAVGKE